jgi:DNA-binding transcriptional LysR family regulator
MLETLKIFRDLVETHSFSRAAAHNFVTQSAASQRIRKLEESLGQRLIVRNRHLELTDAGRILYDATREILARYDQSLAQIRGLEASVSGRVRVATIPSIGLHRLPHCIKDFMGRYPVASLDVEYRTFTEIYQGVLDGSLDLGIVACPLRHPQTVIVPLRGDELVVITPPIHRLARVRRISIARIEGEPFVAFDESAPTRHIVDRTLLRAGVAVRIVQQLDNVETIKRAVEAGTGLSIVPRCVVTREAHDRTLAVIPFANHEMDRPVAVIYRKGKVLNSAAQRLVEVLEREM